MFRENKQHIEDNLFNSMNVMDPRLAEKLKNSWAALFYEHVFCQIDESLFAPLYSSNNGRPNFPVNIFVGLEIIKHLRNYTDEVLFDEYAFNYQISYALGLRTLGERYFAPRTFYEFRTRLYKYSQEFPEKADPIYQHFETLTNHFIQLAHLDIDEGRTDSSQIMSNIKQAGRLSLAYDVLTQGIKSIPEHLLTESLKVFLKPNFKTQFLYKVKTSELGSKIQMLINYCADLLQVVEGNPESKNPEIQLVERFIHEQAIFDENLKHWVAKENKEISSNALQSAYDPDATYRNKNGKKHVGYALNLTETCADENPVQLITHYDLAPNTTSDVELLKKALPSLKDLGIKDLYVDGGYYSPEIEKEAKGLNLHYTNMTGRKVSQDKLPYSAFKIENQQKILSCPEGHLPERADFNVKSKTLSAHFNLEICKQCPQKDACRVKFQKKDTVLYVSQKALVAEETRMKMTRPEERKKSTSKRAAIEGTNSVLKRAFHAGKLTVRGLVRSTLVIGLKIIAHNFRQITRYFKGDRRKNYRTPNQGISLPICAA